MRRDRFVVMELEGFRIGKAKNVAGNGRPGIEVCVHDMRVGGRIMGSFASESYLNGHLRREAMQAFARRDAAALAARLNAEHRLEAVSPTDGTES